MTLSRRTAVLSMAALPISRVLGQNGDAASPLTGTWHVTSAVTSVILSIEPGGEALGMLIENGAHSMWRTQWRKLDGGLVVEGTPMFRLWPGRNLEEARAEMEPISEDLEVSGGLRQFPLAFFMRRVARAPRNTMGRKLPKGWDTAKPDPEWDLKAGRRRQAGKQP